MKHEKPWWAPEIEAMLALLSLFVFSAVTAAVLYQTVPEKNEKYAMLLLGALIGVVKDTFARYFNVTKGAAEQRQTIANLATAAAAGATPIVETTNTVKTTEAGDAAKS